MFRRKKVNTKKNKSVNKKPIQINNQQRLILGSFVTLLGIFILISHIFLFSGNKDQSILNNFEDKNAKADNLLSKVGAFIVSLLTTFGISSILIIGLIIVSGVFILFNSKRSKLFRLWFWGLFNTLWLSLSFGFVGGKYDFFGGKIGFETINQYLQIYIGEIGVIFIIIMFIVSYLIRLSNTKSAIWMDTKTSEE